MGRNASKSSLARANQDKDYQIFEKYAYYLVNEARQKRVSNKIEIVTINVNAWTQRTEKPPARLLLLNGFCQALLISSKEPRTIARPKEEEDQL